MWGQTNCVGSGVADRSLTAGIRAFFSGGAQELDDETLINLSLTAIRALRGRLIRFQCQYADRVHLVLDAHSYRGRELAKRHHVVVRLACRSYQTYASKFHWDREKADQNRKVTCMWCKKYSTATDKYTKDVLTPGEFVAR